MENDIIKEEEAQKLVEEYKEKYELDKLEELLKDNKAEFTHEEKRYRIRLLSIGEKDELNTLRIKRFSQLMKDQDILCERDLIKLYKTRGIDIDKLDEDINKIKIEFLNIQVKLGESLTNKIGEEVLKTYKTELENLDRRLSILNMQRVTLVECSLENQIQNYVYEILTFLSLDIFEDNDWKRAFKTMEDFRNCNDSVLVTKAARLSMLYHNVR